jgi:hypothetical protein
MIIKIIWVLIGLNALTLAILTVIFLFSMEGRRVDSMEKGWMFVLFAVGLVIILLAAIPLRVSQSTFSIIFSAFFAALPLVVGSAILISNKLPSFKKEKTMAELYYGNTKQRGIAAAIEQGDTTLLQELIKGQDLNIQGNRVWDWDGLNYLQFAVRMRSKVSEFPAYEVANTASIRILVENGSATTPALGEAISYLPVETISMLLNAGADANVRSNNYPQPILFDAIGATRHEIEIAMLLIQHGADVNAINGDGMTPVMFAANNARTSSHWKEIWPFVHYLLKEAKCDYAVTTYSGDNLRNIIRMIRKNAKDEQIVMVPEFNNVVEWLKQHGIDTEPIE